MRAEGGCLCGATRFCVTGPWTNACFCHCRSCRLASGAPFVAWATVPHAAFRLTRGELSEVASSSDVVRGFCGSCGTSITYAHRGHRPDALDVALAALDDPGAIEPACHLWVSEKLPWIVLGDGLPQHAEWRETSGT
jgi:hypothetical protein